MNSGSAASARRKQNLNQETALHIHPTPSQASCAEATNSSKPTTMCDKHNGWSQDYHSAHRQYTSKKAGSMARANLGFPTIPLMPRYNLGLVVRHYTTAPAAPQYSTKAAASASNSTVSDLLLSTVKVEQARYKNQFHIHLSTKKFNAPEVGSHPIAVRWQIPSVFRVVRRSVARFSCFVVVDPIRNRPELP